jgi:hypothetical protein
MGRRSFGGVVPNHGDWTFALIVHVPAGKNLSSFTEPSLRGLVEDWSDLRLQWRGIVDIFNVGSTAERSDQRLR